LSGFDAAITGDGNAERVGGARVTPNHFQVMRARPVLGRTFRPDESDPGRGNVVLLSHALWATRYGADPDIIGRTLHLDYQPHVVIGVMSGDYRPIEPEHRLWVPQQVEPGTTVGTDGTWWIRTRIGRLAPGVTADAAQSEMRASVMRLADLYPDNVDDDDARRASVLPLQIALVGDFSETLWVLFGAVGLVLVIACSNVASLLLSRVGKKEREVALRTAVGATRRQVVTYLLTESLVLGLIGGSAGIALAWGALTVLKAGAPTDLPRIGEAQLSGSVLAFALTATLVTPMIFGLLPAWRATRRSVREVLGSGGRGLGGSAGPGRLTSTLIAGEMALAVVLVVGAGLMVKTLWRLQSVDPGFRVERILTMHVTLPPTGEGTDGDVDRTGYRQLWDAIAAVRGVEAVGGIHLLPLSQGNNRYPFWAEDNEPASGTLAPAANIRVATPEYLDAIGIDLLEGRWFTRFDRFDGAPVMVINRALANRLWPGTSAIGKRLHLLAEDSFQWEVVGVIGDVNQMSLARAPSAEIYLPHEQWTWPTMYATIRTAGSPAPLVPAVRQAIRDLDPDIAVSRVATMEQVVAGSMASTRFLAMLTVVFGSLALLMGAVGVYGVTSHAVSRRMPEFGIRMALGSSRVRVLETAMAHGLVPVLIGMIIGLGAAWMASRLLANLLFGIQPTDPTTYGAVVLVLMAVAWFATYLPARRASAADPTTALRAE